LHLHAFPLPRNGGNVRRYQAFVDDYLQPLIPVHRFITVAAIVTGDCAVDLPVQPDAQPFRGKPAPENPWEATSLEWSTPTPVRLSTILAASIPWFITIPISMGCRVQPAIT
jgi:cytochrome c oxidase subunit 1